MGKPGASVSFEIVDEDPTGKLYSIPKSHQWRPNHIRMTEPSLIWERDMRAITVHLTGENNWREENNDYVGNWDAKRVKEWVANIPRAQRIANKTTVAAFKEYAG